MIQPTKDIDTMNVVSSLPHIPAKFNEIAKSLEIHARYSMQAVGYTYMIYKYNHR